MLTLQIEYKQNRLTTAAATTTMVATTPFGQNSGWRGRLAQFSSRVREQSNTKWKHWQASTNLHPEPFLLLRSRLIKNIVNWRKYLTKFRWFLFGKSQHKTYVANIWRCKNNVLICFRTTNYRGELVRLELSCLADLNPIHWYRRKVCGSPRSHKRSWQPSTSSCTQWHRWRNWPSSLAFYFQCSIWLSCLNFCLQFWT